MEVIGAILGLVGTLLGTYLGFSLSERAAKTRQVQIDRELTHSVRTVIRIEIDRNLFRLHTFLLAVQYEEAPLPRDSQGKRSALRGVNLPIWSHAIWESQLPLAAKALTESEFEQVLDFHSSLDTLSIAHIDMRDRSDNINQVNTLYNQFMELFNDVTAKGNPIR